MKRLLFASALFTATTPAMAAQQIPVAGTIHDPEKMPGGLYKLDGNHAHAIFFINHMGFSEYAGGFNDIQGQLVYRPEKPEASKLNATIKVASIAVNNNTLIQHLESSEFFEADKYPEITFVSRQLTSAGPDKGTLTGDLTMHGVTRPVTLDVKFMGGGVMPMTNATVMGFTASGVLKRSDFGMDNFLPGLGDEVRLDISAEFDRVDTAPKTEQR